MNPCPEKQLEPGVIQRSFKSLFCEQRGCLPWEFEERAFQECLYWRARALAPLIRKYFPRMFEDDFLLIRYLGEAKDPREVAKELSAFTEATVSKGNFARNHLRIRISARKAGKLAREIFGRV